MGVWESNPCPVERLINHLAGRKTYFFVSFLLKMRSSSSLPHNSFIATFQGDLRCSGSKKAAGDKEHKAPE